MYNINIEILRLLYAKRKHIIIITAAAALLAIVFSMPLFMKPKFKSTIIVYPANLAPYSEESPTEQLMQFLTSNEVKKTVMRKFDLPKHYDMDSTADKFDTYFTLKYEENIIINQTRYESIQIEVYDTDPAMAQKLAYGVVEASNTVIRKALNEKIEEFLVMNTRQMNEKRREVDSLGLEIQKATLKYGLMDYYIQIKEVSKNMYKKGADINRFNEVMKNLANEGPKFMELTELFKNRVLFYINTTSEVEGNIKNIKKVFSYSTVVSKPNLPDSKAAPKRSIIVLMACLGALLFSCLYFIFIERLKKLSAEVVKK